MAYIGNRPEQGNFRKADQITCSATATYNLLVGGVAVNPNQNQCIVSLNGVIQSSGTSYTIASSQITFASALTSSDVIDFILILGDTLDVGVPSDDTCSQAKIQNEAINEAKMQISNAGTNGQYLQKQSGNTGGLTWADAGIDGWSSNSGNLLPADATKGIYLGVNSATAANLLDDYEEGTWTPVWQGLSGSAGSSSTSASAAVYTKIGRLVSFSCQARWSNQGSYSGLAVLTGLPFTSSSSNSSGCAFGFIELIDFKGGTLISAQVAGSQSYITWREINDDGSPTGLDISAFDNSGNDMVITGQYIV